MQNSTQKNADLGHDPVRKLLFKLAVPAIVAQLINVLYNMVDRMYIGHIPEVGAAALTGVGVAMPLIMCISAFAALVSMGGAPRAAIMMGRKDNKTAENILGNCTTALVIVAVVLTVFIQIFGRRILLLFGASENTIGYSWSYMQIYALGTIAVQLSLGLNAFINTQGFARTGMLTVLIGAICNIILDPILIFGLNMGVRGAALATIISQSISCIWILRFLCGSKTILKIRRSYLKPDPGILLPCLALGTAPFIMQFSESILNICFNSSLLKYGGDTAVGAMTILTSLMQFMVLPLQGLTQGAQPIISYNYGAGNGSRVKETFRLLLVCCLTFSGIMWLGCMTIPQGFIGIFTSDPALMKFSVWAIRIYMGAGLLLGAQIACQQTFVAIGQARVSVFLALLRKVLLLIPMIYILPALIADQTFAVYLAEPIADCLAVLTTSLLFLRQYRKL